MGCGVGGGLSGDGYYGFGGPFCPNIYFLHSASFFLAWYMHERKYVWYHVICNQTFIFLDITYPAKQMVCDFLSDIMTSLEGKMTSDMQLLTLVMSDVRRLFSLMWYMWYMSVGGKGGWKLLQMMPCWKKDSPITTWLNGRNL